MTACDGRKWDHLTSCSTSCVSPEVSPTSGKSNSDWVSSSVWSADKCQHDWYSFINLALSRRGYKQNIRSSSLLVWVYWLSQSKFNLETKSGPLPTASQSVIDILLPTLTSLNLHHHKPIGIDGKSTPNSHWSSALHMGSWSSAKSRAVMEVTFMAMPARTWKYFLAADEDHVLRLVAAVTEKEPVSALLVHWQSAAWNPILYIFGKMAGEIHPQFDFSPLSQSNCYW